MGSGRLSSKIPRRLCLNVGALLMLVTASGCTKLSPAASSTATPGKEPTPVYILPTASWIEVDLRRQLLILHAAGSVMEALPASTGVPDAPTPPGLYRVQSKEKGPIESVPGVFVEDVIMFDIGRGNGIHSRPMGADGALLDERLGQPLTAGCVRVGDSLSVFEFAELGMRVWIH